MKAYSVVEVLELPNKKCCSSFQSGASIKIGALRVIVEKRDLGVVIWKK